MASSQPPPPPLPPLPLELIHNSELGLVPQDEKKSALSSALNSIQHSAVVVGVMGDNNEATTTFANRLIGRLAFMQVQDDHSMSIRMFYDLERKTIVLLGLFSDSRSMVKENVYQEQVKMQCDQMKMQLLMFTSSHVLFVVHDHARVSNAETKLFRSLSLAKQHLLQVLKSQAKASKSSITTSQYAPGRSVPLTVFVFPAPSEALARSNKASRSTIMAFCKAMEARVHALVKPLRGGVVATVRAKDMSSQSNKERRLFMMDPTHCIVAVTRKAATAECSSVDRMAAVLQDLNLLAPVDLKTLLKPLEDEDNIGMPHAIQFAFKCVDLLLQDAGKDHLLSVAQWLRAFRSIAASIMDDSLLFQSSSSSSSDDITVDFKDSPLTLVEAIDMYGTFADDICSRESLLAIKRYQQEKPEKINSDMHLNRVQRVIQEFKRSVGNSNPKILKYTERIENACQSIWCQGRRLCDATSISNHPCCLLYHDNAATFIQHNSSVYLTVACCCGYSINRLADAFSIDTNRRELWMFECCDRFDHIELPHHTLPLIRLGDFSSYNQGHGFANIYHGFVPKFTALSPWLRGPDAPIQTKKRTNRKAKAAAVGASNELIAYAGLEYECYMGHRFFFHMPVNHTPLEREATVWPNCDMAIYVQCFQCALSANGEPTEFAQLRRVFAAIPPDQDGIEMHLSIKTEDQALEVFKLLDYPLAADSLICLTLPYVFSSGDITYRHGDALKLHSRVLQAK
ncbi:hypothetical protein AC1031_000421 [Aphanomyces cochlioides]|nr:hypothetical protein AC1031_000421 [Aphanomyces cochlioides]